MYSNVCNYNHTDNLKGMLYQLWTLQCEGITPEWKVTYNAMRDNFIKELSSDINVTISFFNSLNLNNEADAFVTHFIDQITKNFKTQEEKKKFKQLITTLSEQYSDSPHIDWGILGFYSAMHAMEDLNTDDEDM